MKVVILSDTLKYIFSTVICTILDTERVLPQEAKQKTNFMKTFRKGCGDLGQQRIFQYYSTTVVSLSGVLSSLRMMRV